MSVIAKLVVRHVESFPTGHRVELGCWCDNDLMANYAETEKDKLFTTASPWGEAVLNQPRGELIGDKDAAFYVMVLSDEEAGEAPEFPGAVVVIRGKISSILDMGDFQAKKVEFALFDRTKSRAADQFTWKMSIDNPGATNQLKAGTYRWFAFYPSGPYDRDTAIAAAHGRA